MAVYGFVVRRGVCEEVKDVTERNCTKVTFCYKRQCKNSVILCVSRTTNIFMPLNIDT